MDNLEICDGCGKSFVPVDTDENPAVACNACERRLPPSLRKALADPFDYKMKIRTGETFRFHDARLHGEFVTLELHPGLDIRMEELGAAHSFERGVDVRIADIVWCADAPDGS